MASHLLDTSVYCQPLKPRPMAGVISRWNRLGDAALTTSVIADAEVQFGLRLKASANLWNAYQGVLRGRIPILIVDEIVGESFAVLKEQHHEGGSAEFAPIIASTPYRALPHQCFTQKSSHIIFFG